MIHTIQNGQKEINDFKMSPKTGYFSYGPELNVLQSVSFLCNDTFIIGDLRGKVAFDEQTDTYKIYVGKWINKYPNAIEIVKAEFYLENQKIEVCEQMQI